MLIRKMEEFQKLSFKEKNELINRLAVYPAITVMVWARSDIGGRLVGMHAGVMCFFLLLAGMFVAGPIDRICFYSFTIGTLLLSMRQRYQRWREFHKGVRQHSFYLGTGANPKNPKFLTRNRRTERLFQPLLIIIMGLAVTNVAAVTGGWIIFSALCLAGVESWTRDKHYEEQMDLVDGMVKSEIQTETVEQFAEPAPPPVMRPVYSGAIPTGLGSDITHKLRSRPKR